MMPTASTRRFRRRVSATRETGAFNKESAAGQGFFGNIMQGSFFQPAIAVQRKCEHCEEEKKVQRIPGKKEEEKMVQKKDNGTAGSTGTGTATYIHNINSKGQSLPKQQQYFFGARLGHNLGQVKIHTGTEAAASAKAINAQAYTSGDHIVFNESRYQPGSADGQKLIAHELVHVLQNRLGSTNGIISRKASFNTGKVLKDINLATNYFTAVTKGANKSHVGITTPFLNGHDLTQSLAATPLLSPAESDLSAVEENGQFKSTVTTVPENNFTYEMHIPIHKKVWKEYVAAADIKSNLRKPCPGMINVYISGDPDSKTIIQSIQAHEETHVAHWQDLFNSFIVPFDKKMQLANGRGKTAPDSKLALVKHLQQTAKAIYGTFIAQYSQRATDFHASTAGALATFTAVDQDPSCMWVKINITI